MLKAVSSELGDTGTVTTVSVVSANGFSGTVANPTTTPAITLMLGSRVTAKATTPYSVLTTDVGTTFTNEGATSQIVFNLPTAAAGYLYTFFVQDSDGLQVVASAGDTLRLGGSVSATAGNIASTTIGSSVTLISINATEWVAVSLIGTWVVT